MDKHMHHGGPRSRASAAQTVPEAMERAHHGGQDRNMRDMNIDDMDMHDMNTQELNVSHGMHQIQHDMSEPEKHYTGHTMPEKAKQTPLYISVALSVCHCGAGCVLGDIVGEWIVYATNVQINGRSLWPEMLIGFHPPSGNLAPLFSSGMLMVRV